MSLKYEPSSEPLRISMNQLFLTPNPVTDAAGLPGVRFLLPGRNGTRHQKHPWRLRRGAVSYERGTPVDAMAHGD